MFSIQAKLAALAIAIALIAAGAWMLRHDGYKAGADDVRKEYAAAATAAALAAIKTQERLQDAVQTVGERHEKTKRANAASAAAAGSELDGLRHEIATRDRAATAAPGAAGRADASGAERELLGQCASVLVGVAQEADRIEAKLGALQDYVRNVCQAPP